MNNIQYISAGAGSGKTYELTHILVDLIKEKKVKPQEVIMTTFTEKAAAELREKAREVLYENSLYEEAALLDQAIIGTVHSVGNTFINKYWYLLGLNAEMSVMSDEDKGFYINQSLADLGTNDDIKAFKLFRDEFNIQKQSDGSSHQSAPDEGFWKGILSNIIDKALSNNISDMKLSVEQSKAMVNAVLNIKDDNLIEIDENEWREMESFVFNVATDLNDEKRIDSFREYKDLGHWHTYQMNGFINKLQGLPKKNYLNKYPEISSFVSEHSNLWHTKKVRDMLYDLIDRIFRIAENWLKVYSDYKRSKSIIDYNDMEQYFLTLLENNDIAEDIRGRYKYVFVDEFQDCNPVQVKIFDKLSEYVEGSYWVGDGKQAIYGFRGTDTCLTASVAEIISDNKSHFKTLSNSYRSLPDIVNVVNEFFTRVFVNRLNMMKEENVVLKATKKDESNTQQLTLLNTNAKNKDNFGMAIAKKIACLINEEGKSPETIAVLGRNKSDFTSVVNYLHAQGIPVNSESSDKLEEQEETTLLTSILSLIIDGHDELAKAQIAFLTTPDTSIENIIDSRLDYLAEQNDNEWLHDNDMIRKVEEQRKDLSVLSVAAMVESAIMRLDLFSVVTRWGDSEKRKSNLENIIALAHQYEERCVTMTLGASVTGFISYINNAQATSTGDSKGVFVNTYHKSKGLEWDTVILISLDKKPSDEDAFIKRGFLGVNLVNTETPNKDNLYPLKYINMMPNIFTNNNAKMPDDINESIKAMDSYSSSLENNIREEARLMYVGMTRAKEQLILACKSRDSLSWLNDISGSDLKMPANNGRADVLQTGIQFNVEVMESSDDDETNEEEYTCKVVSLPENEDIITEELRYQSPSVMTKTSTDVSIKHDFGKRINLNGEKNMQVVGDCIHNIFCVLRQGDENNNINKAEKLIVAYLLQEKIHATEVTSAYTSFLTEMKQLYGEATNVYHELEFSYPQNGCIVRGSMDFVYETPQGCVLVDFKSNPEGKTAVTNKENELYAGNYNTQFTCYASALKKQGKKVIEKLVYYPVSGLLLKLK